MAEKSGFLLSVMKDKPVFNLTHQVSRGGAERRADKLNCFDFKVIERT